MSLSSISLSGMNAAQAQLDAAANNVANNQTPGYQRRVVQQTAQPTGGVSTKVEKTSQEGSSPEQDLVAQMQAKSSYLSNLSIFKSSNSMMGVLLNQKA